jgi:RNA polymerase sigma factor (sigma-70 family)
MAAMGHAETLAIRAQLNRPSLTAERERHLLLTRHTSADEGVRHQALSELWESHSKLVVAVARQYHRPDLEMTDLVGAGHLGMHAAIEGFDPDRFGTRLSTYAIGWIRHYIQDYIRRHAYPVRPPSSDAHRLLFRMTSKLFAEARRSCMRDGVQPTDSELCARIGLRIGLSGDEVARCLSLARGDALSVHHDDEDSPRADELTAQDPSPEEAVILRLDHDKLRRRILAFARDILGERERRVFLARCMCNDDTVAHLDSLAAELGVTRERVYQLEVSAKRKIAVALTHDGLLDPATGTFEMPKLRAPRRPHRRETVVAAE